MLKKHVGVFTFLIVMMAWSLSVSAHSVSYSLLDSNGVPLDLKLIERMPMPIANGIFVEVGAYDGIQQSNTKLLEEQWGWTGILIEPSPDLFQALKTNRPTAHCFSCALGSFEEDNTYVNGDFDGHFMSSVGGSRLHNPAPYRVLMRSLQSILDEVGISHIHFFSLDTEGYELNILKGIDFNKTTFDFLLIEIYSSEFIDIISYLFERGYWMVENFSNYNHHTNPGWDGTHNDYLFVRK